MSLKLTVNHPAQAAGPGMIVGRLASARSGANLRAIPGRAESTDFIRALLTQAAQAQRIIADQRARIARLEALSVTDDLTGLLNRRGFRLALDLTLDQAARFREHGLLSVLDLDGFKQINDRFGHAAGDAVLCAVARHLRTSVRSTDFTARLGGDEFAVLLVRAGHMAGRRRMLGLQRSLNRLVVPIKGAELQVHASLGLHPYEPHTRADDLMRRADAAMYHEKRRRNGSPSLPLQRRLAVRQGS